jgi:hypothetical protein
MKILHLTSNYSKYNLYFNERLLSGLNENLISEWSKVEELYLNDCFNMGHIMTPELRALGHEVNHIVINNTATQELWKKIYAPDFGGEGFDLVNLQVNHYKPDVLYVLDPIMIDGRLVSELKFRPECIAGWRAAPITGSTTLKGYDLMLSSVPSLLAQFKALGARTASLHFPGYRHGIVSRKPLENDSTRKLCFSGSVGGLHRGRIRLLSELSKYQLSICCPLQINYYLDTDPSVDLPVGVQLNRAPPLWGKYALETLSESSATFHVPLDMAETNCTAMRVFEVTGLGLPLFIPDSANLMGLFSEEEVIRFQSAVDLLDKFVAISNSDLEIVGSKGQIRCLTAHSMEVRAKEFLAHLAKI